MYLFWEYHIYKPESLPDTCNFPASFVTLSLNKPFYCKWYSTIDAGVTASYGRAIGLNYLQLL